MLKTLDCLEGKAQSSGASVILFRGHASTSPLIRLLEAVRTASRILAESFSRHNLTADSRV